MDKIDRVMERKQVKSLFSAWLLPNVIHLELTIYRSLVDKPTTPKTEGHVTIFTDKNKDSSAYNNNNNNKKKKKGEKNLYSVYACEGVINNSELLHYSGAEVLSWNERHI